MSLSILEQLEKRTTPKKMKKVAIRLEKGQVAIQSTDIVDKSDESAFDLRAFRKKVKKIPERLSVAQKIPEGDSIAVVSGPTAAAVTASATAAPDTDAATSIPVAEKTQLEGDEESVIREAKSAAQKLPTESQEGDSPVTTPPEKTKQRIKLPGTAKKTRKPRAPTRAPEEVKLTIPATLIQVNDEPIEVRLKPKEPAVNIKASAYFMNNREIFVNFINSIFKSYGKKANRASAAMTCDSLIAAKKSKEFSLMVHQQIIRDYINVFSPYRGLLLYHGLGAGKTCGSIAIAEGLKNFNKIIVMTPASLRTNYIEELKSCGDPIYKKNQYWEKNINKRKPTY